MCYRVKISSCTKVVENLVILNKMKYFSLLSWILQVISRKFSIGNLISNVSEIFLSSQSIDFFYCTLNYIYYISTLSLEEHWRCTILPQFLTKNIKSVQKLIIFQSFFKRQKLHFYKIRILGPRIVL